MAKRFKQDSLKTLGFCNLDKNDVIDGAPSRDPDQMSLMSIPSTSSSSTLAISSHSSAAILHGGFVNVHDRQVNADSYVPYEDMTAKETWRIRTMDNDESDGCIDWLNLAPIDHHLSMFLQQHLQ